MYYRHVYLWLVMYKSVKNNPWDCTKCPKFKRSDFTNMFWVEIRKRWCVNISPRMLYCYTLLHRNNVDLCFPFKTPPPFGMRAWHRREIEFITLRIPCLSCFSSVNAPLILRISSCRTLYDTQSCSLLPQIKV